MKSTDLGSMKRILRILIALFGSVFSAGLTSASMCGPSQGLTSRPRWADVVCAHVPYAWLVLIPILFAFFHFLLGRSCAPFRRHIVVVLWLIYGLYGCVFWIDWQRGWTALYPLASIAAAVGVALQKFWGRLLVYAMSALFIAGWCWGTAVAARAGTFPGPSVLFTVLQLMPGTAFVLLALFSCYVVTPLSAPTPASRSPGA
jgi:hypothetical protein